MRSSNRGGANAANAQGQQQAEQEAGPVANVTAQQDVDLNGLTAKLRGVELETRDVGRDGRTGGRADQQSIPIVTVVLAGDFHKLARPARTSYVYDQTIVSNGAGTVLLAGPVASYLDDQFMGAGTLPTVGRRARSRSGPSWPGRPSSTRAS